MFSVLISSSEKPIEAATTGAILNEVRALGIHAEVVHPTDVSYVCTRQSLRIIDAEGNNLSQIDRVLIRRTRGAVGASLDLIAAFTALGTRTIEKAGCFFNPLSKVGGAIARAGRLSAPDTWVLRRPGNLKVLQDAISFPLLVKPFQGTGGEGIVRVTGPTELAEQVEMHFEAGGGTDEPLLLQRWIDKQNDYRILVVGDRAVATIGREPEDRDAEAWNIAQDAQPVRVEKRPDLEELAVRVAASDGVEMAGVDIIEDGDGRLWILECNRNPNFTGVQAAYPEINVPRLIAEYVRDTSAV